MSVFRLSDRLFAVCGYLMPQSAQLGHAWQDNVGALRGERGVGERSAVDGNGEYPCGYSRLDTERGVLHDDALPRLEVACFGKPHEIRIGCGFARLTS